MRDHLSKSIACLTLTLVTSTPGCREDSSTKSNGKAPLEQTHASLVFPDSLRVPDEDVNMFVRSALGLCAKGDYDSFRSLWSAKQEPLSRSEFEEGWEAIDRIEVRGLQRVLLAAEDGGNATTPVYVLLVNVSLDPTHKAGKREPLREIVLMLVHELGQWRIAAAPKPMRDWIKKQGDVPANNTKASPTPTTPNP